MKFRHNTSGRSAGYARDRMKLLLVSERIDCSPQMMKMIRTDLIRTLKKYVVFEESQVHMKITQEPPVLYLKVPVMTDQKERGRNAKTV